jgi:hypothetical protein
MRRPELVFASAAFWVIRDGVLDGAALDGAMLKTVIVVGARVGSSNNGIKPE